MIVLHSLKRINDTGEGNNKVDHLVEPTPRAIRLNGVAPTEYVYPFPKVQFGRSCPNVFSTILDINFGIGR